jgi:hypothetical protein
MYQVTRIEGIACSDCSGARAWRHVLRAIASGRPAATGRPRDGEEQDHAQRTARGLFVHRATDVITRVEVCKSGASSD